MEDEKPPCEKRNPCYNILQSDRELQLQIAINCQAKTRFHAENSAANFKLQNFQSEKRLKPFSAGVCSLQEGADEPVAPR
jgi:hypothetical protein